MRCSYRHLLEDMSLSNILHCIRMPALFVFCASTAEGTVVSYTAVLPQHNRFMGNLCTDSQPKAW
jgi:hypothetical protein